MPREDVLMKPATRIDFVHKFILGKSKNAFTLLLLHGTGGNENDLLPLAGELAPGSAVLSPRGKVLENGMPRFFRRLAEGVFDVEDLKYRTNELADFVNWASSHYGFDLERIVAVGYSNGANIAMSLFLLRPEVLGRAILFRSMVPLVPEDPPDLTGKDVFVSAGAGDLIVTRSKVEELVELLQGYGADVFLNWAASGHTLTMEEVQKARDWLDKIFGQKSRALVE
jgi:phospholipase/carboxylesterase/glyoxalase family protein